MHLTFRNTRLVLIFWTWLVNPELIGKSDITYDYSIHIIIPGQSFILHVAPNGYITCVVAGLDSASDADTSEAGRMLLEAADSTTSGACFVRCDLATPST